MPQTPVYKLQHGVGKLATEITWARTPDASTRGSGLLSHVHVWTVYSSLYIFLSLCLTRRLCVDSFINVSIHVHMYALAQAPALGWGVSLGEGGAMVALSYLG